MAKNNSDAFDLLNNEFANVELEKENTRNLENLRRRQAAAQQIAVDDDYDEDENEDEEDSGGSGCFGIALRILLIMILAGALAWIVFMPDGSLNELWGKVYPEVEGAYSWVAGFFGGESRDGDPDNAAAADKTDAVSSEEEDIDDSPALTGDDEATVGSESDGEIQDTETGDSPYSITVYRPSQIVIVYDSSGNPAKIFSCSSGKAATPTKLGDYAIRAKYRWRFMVGNCYTQYASSFSSGYLFHSIPYNKKNAGTMSNSSYDKLGNPASSGCIRLCFRDTKWIYDNCPIGTQVHVVDEKAPAGSVPEIIPERIKDSVHNGWDPTDEAPESPYNK